MINKIIIRKSDRKTLHKDRRSLGMNGENLQEVLLFCLDEKIEGNGIVEVELPDGTKGMIEVDRTEEGYELPVKSSLLTQTGFVKFQLRILHDDVEIFKSEIIALEVKDSINATATIPEEYPSWVDTLTNLKKDLEKAESERVSNENERISAEKTRQENFTKMQETVSSAVSNIKDLTEEYNSNAKKETKKFNDNAVDQTKTFNDNSDSKLAEYNKNNTDKIKEYDDNAKAKLDEYNKNDKTKTDAYNNNASNKEETFNTNAEQKETELEELAEEKINEYNQVSAELTAKVEQVQAENEILKAENKLIKEQIPSASASGNSVHIEDSSNLDFDWKIRGGHYQKQTIQNDNLLILEDTTITKNGITLTIKDGVITINGTSTASTNIDFKIKKKLKAGTYWHMVQRIGDAPSGNVGFLVMKSGGVIATINGRGGASFTLNEDTEVFYRIWTDKNNIISNVAYKCLISEGSDSKPWVQGIPDSPSVDYPSVIETVGSNENLLENKAITQTINGVTFTVNKDGSVLANGTATTNTTFKINNDIVPKNISNLILSGCPNNGSKSTYDLKIELYKNSVWTKALYDFGNGVDTGDLSEYTSCTISITIRKDYNANNLIFKPKLEKGSIATPYSPYNQGSVEIDVVNKNWLTNFENINDTDSGITMIGNKDNVKVTGTATKDWVDSNFAELENLQAGNYIFSYLSEQRLKYKIWIFNSEKSAIIYNLGLNQKISVPQNYKKLFFKIILEKMTVGQIVNDTVHFQIEKGSTSTNIVKHQSQTAIMPIQQEMLEGDYVADVEHHEWGKAILSGNEDVIIDGTYSGITQFKIAILNVKKQSNPSEICVLSNYFLGVEWNNSWTKNNSIVNRSDNSVRVMTSKYTTIDGFKALLKSKYDEGNPVVIYYKLEKTINLELTEEQKTVRDTKLYTYKNITNISLSDELASIEVEYKKDQDTINKNYENRLAALEAASIS